jgi:hypothetical protein
VLRVNVDLIVKLIGVESEAPGAEINSQGIRAKNKKPFANEGLLIVEFIGPEPFIINPHHHLRILIF